MINRVRDRHRYRSCFYQRHHAGDDSKFLKKYSRAQSDPSNYETVQLPTVLSLQNVMSRDLLLKCVKRIHNKTKRCLNICLDFTETNRIFAEGMLYLFAEVDNLLNIYSKIKFTCIRSRNNKMNHVLHQIGMFRLCKHRFTAQNEYRDVVHWKTCQGVRVIAEQFDKVIDPEKVLQKIPQSMDIYGGCVEATKNASIHAYIENRPLSSVAHMVTSWWIFSQIKDGKITLAVCDLGLGIPKTLPQTNKSLFRKIIATISGRTDADLIAGAIDTPSSRTQKGYRGNGLKKIARIAQNDSRASFAIYSGKGYISTRNGKRSTLNYVRPLPGTIVMWTLPLRDTNEDY